MAQTTPLPFLIIQKAFPILESISTRLSGKLANYLFFRPFPVPYRKEELALLEKAKRFDLSIDSRTIKGYHWENKEATKTAVFMHGWAGNAAQPHDMIVALVKEGYRVFAFDAPGHGASDGKRTHALEFVHLLKELQQQIGHIHLLIAHSFGAIASCHALIRGLTVDKFVSLAAPVIASDVLIEFSKIINCTRKSTAVIEDLVLEEFGFPFKNVSIEYLAPELPEIPILIMHDKLDKRVGWFNSERMHQLLPNSTFISTEGLGHNRILNDIPVIQQIISFSAEKVPELLESRA